MTRFLLLLLLAGCAKPPIIHPLFFEEGSAEMVSSNPKNAATLKEAIGILEGNDKWSVLVVGLSDLSGDKGDDRELAQARADFARAQLIEAVPGAKRRVHTHILPRRKAGGKGPRSQRRVEFLFFVDKGQGPLDIIAVSPIL